MTYKLIAIDLDDTLLNDERIVTDATRQALAEAVKKDVLVTIATGRMHASAKQIAAQLDLNVPIITYQGAMIKNLLDDTVLYERYVPETAVGSIIDYAEKKQLHLQAYCDDILYSKYDNEKVQTYAKMSNVDYQVQANFYALPLDRIAKLLFFEEPADLDWIHADIKPAVGEQVHITKSKPYFLEIMHKEGTKGHAVRYLASHIGCSLTETIAIGDSWNDREMIEIAGLGVAMENGVDALKEIADYITLDNNNDGVKHVVEQFIFKNV